MNHHSGTWHEKRWFVPASLFRWMIRDHLRWFLHRPVIWVMCRGYDFSEYR